MEISTALDDRKSLLSISQGAGGPAPPSSEDPEQIFDRSACLARVDGDEDLLGELAKIFLDECPAQLAAVREAVARGDCQTVERTAHALKGAVGNFAAHFVFDRAECLEIQGCLGDLTQAPETLLELERGLELLKPALEKLTPQGAK
jgi:HPt (histidine-containing phosphotransfer) domain-containing protein